MQTTTLALLALLAALPGTPLAAAAQSVKPLIDSQHYTFLAQNAQPLHGPIHYLTTDDFTLEVSKDQITSYLPYYGRDYVAPIDPTQDVLRFTSKKFSYTLKPGKKDGWTVLIKPQDNQEVQQLQFSISSDGYSSLQILFTNRDPITLNGVVLATENRK
ncbi:MAG TPA: DUF4251 domain-containing protein [Puia sp.]|nr:DUF4251 domain-containing protein [Puia sp.]